ncbi:FAD-binding oxidoreductase [Reyranella sp. CPCC 100927]|uniref:NAD(P)/FAD-dependent oxidoreductase n=1 Tax=Reyranella sp. CPCC 100927 TaxID=2599616 RepID=UPI0011B64DE0|nr:FAD-dependent oxidoreductase [Reyranella sp. CPCC 100927]TWT11568.1 FAD-binding oxidoreductase [Reyranella sp. CPCC 100927]
MRVLICGGGVIGAAVAYFLSRRGIEVIVIERTGLACAASGKSGGFLALDWCDGSPLQALARRSFALHAELARQIDGDWGYRRLDTYGGIAAIDWLSPQARRQRRLGSTDSTAQVHPGAFTAALMQAATAHGAVLRAGTVDGLVREDGAARGVVVDDAVVSGDAVLIAMGPWSILATQWLPLPAVFGLKGHSVVFETGAGGPAHAAFVDIEEPSGDVQSPELFPRPDGTTYVCAISSEAPLPVDPAAVAPDPGAIDRLTAICRQLSPALGRAPVQARQACYRPVTRDGLPLIGAIPGVANAYIATGHSVWGILNAPATGEAMAELILDGAARTVDLRPFAPGRLPTFDPVRLRA